MGGGLVLPVAQPNKIAVGFLVLSGFGSRLLQCSCAALPYTAVLMAAATQLLGQRRPAKPTILPSQLAPPLPLTAWSAAIVQVYVVGVPVGGGSNITNQGVVTPIPFSTGLAHAISCGQQFNFFVSVSTNTGTSHMSAVVAWGSNPYTVVCARCALPGDGVRWDGCVLGRGEWCVRGGAGG